MKVQEAIKYMEDEIRCIQKAPYCDKDCANCSLVKEEEPLLEAFYMAIKALEKQIPKKVILNEYGCPYCASCGNVATTDTGDSFLDYWLTYCNKCGQKLD